MAALGALAALTPATVATGNEAQKIKVHPTGKWAYSACRGPSPGRVYQFTREANGELKAMTPAYVASGGAGELKDNAYDIVISPDGKHLYVTNSAEGTVSQFSINQETGALTALTPETVACGTAKELHGLAITPDGKYVYVTNYVSPGVVYQFSRNAETGQLTALSTASVSAGANYHDCYVSPDQKYLYCANGHAEGQVSLFAIGAEGLLTHVAEYATGGEYTECVVVSADGKNVYAVDEVSSTCTSFSIGSEGHLTKLQTLKCPTEASPVGTKAVWCSFDGHNVYVTNQGGEELTLFKRNPYSGELTRMEPASIAAGLHPSHLHESPDGTNLYAANRNAETISQYSREALAQPGELTPLSPATVAAGSEPESVIISPDGKHAYVGHHHEENLGQYSIGADGKLTALSPATVGSAKWPLDGQFSADGKYLYLGSELSTEAEAYVQVYSRNAETGQLTEIQKLAFAKSEPHGAKLSPDGKFLYVPGYSTAAVYVFSINAETGHVTLASTLTGLGGKAKAITFTPDGKYVYIAENAVEGKVAQCSRNAETGALTLLTPSSVAAGKTTEWVAVSADGKHLYASAEGAVYQFAIGSEGTLTALTPASVATTAGVNEQLLCAADGKSVYATNNTAGTVEQMGRNTTSGVLTAMTPASLTSGAGAARVSETPNGSYVYVGNRGTTTVAQFSRYVPPATGGLLGMIL